MYREVVDVFKRVALIPFLLLLFSNPLGFPHVGADEPEIGAFLFSTSGCKPCQRVEDMLVAPPSVCEASQPAENDPYGAESDCLSCGIVHPEHSLWSGSSPAVQLDIRIFDPARPQDYRVLLDLQQSYGAHVRQMPALFVGNAVLEGEEAICQLLSDQVQACLSTGDCTFPLDVQPSHAPELPSMVPPPQLLQRASPLVPGLAGYSGTEAECPSCLFGAQPVSAIYFYRGTHWLEEQWSWFVMRYWLEHRQNLGLRTFDVDYPENEALWQNLCQYFDRSVDCATPAVFVGAYSLLEEEIEIAPLVAVWQEYSRELMPYPSQLLAEGASRPEPAYPATSGPDAGDPEALATVQTAEAGVANAVFFYTTGCPHCKVVEEEVLPLMQSQYGSQLDVQAVDASEPQGYELLLELEHRHGVRVSDVPVVFIDDTVLEGEEMIREGLTAHIEVCLKRGGCAPLTDRQPSTGTSAVEAGQSVAIQEELGPGVTAHRGTGSEGSGQAPISVAYFFEQGCQVCDRAWVDLSHVLGKYANVYLRVYDIGIPDNKVLHEALSLHYGVPEERHLSTPALFVGDRYFLGHDITLSQLEAAVRENSAPAVPAPWELVAKEMASARGRIVGRFQSFGLYTVVAAGLIDGLNPCAFATIVLFISYLAISGRRGREILSVGGAFTLGVFLAYLLVGVGLWRLLASFDFLESVGRWVYLITGLICLGLGVLSILDYRRARRGDLDDMTLSLPHGLRMRINAVIRQGRRARAYVGAAFITGLAVSIIELACTGQVYLPTIIFVMGVAELRVRAFLYLVLYNLMFVLPLAVVFILAFRGTTSKQLTRFVQSRAAAVKLAMSGLFFALSAWLLYAVIVG
jgi:cytochrome c biogenesis protein CcdA/thiol-disulfide isomerase/thioredoxin